MTKHTGSWDNPGRTERDEHHRPGDRPAPVWFLEERYRVGHAPAARSAICDDRAQALAGFATLLIQAAESGEEYSPWDVRRRLVVVGPDLHRRTDGDDAVLHIADWDDVDDPLLHWDVALREVLGDDYDLIAHGPRVAAVLES